ncbi:MAG TPA: DNA alkylation repair protein [Thermodesulfovibrionales bacterium]|nr:DNA alkylation repair protein [Thermodesulfovibrionales bacterium]
MNSPLDEIRGELREKADPGKAAILARFFKTGKGEYGEGDIFLGIVVPEQRKIAKRYPELTLKHIKTLLSEKIHEHRLVALFILVSKYKKSSSSGKKEIFDFYLKQTRHINNWDLVDLSAPNIVGDYLLRGDRSVLYELAKSENLWKRRIAVLATFAFIKNDEFDDAFSIAELLIGDKHDLIHKAVGWMLREAGKRDRGAEENFLKKHYRVMPRTMLRYAIEKFSEEERKSYLRKTRA